MSSCKGDIVAVVLISAFQAFWLPMAAQAQPDNQPLPLKGLNSLGVYPQLDKNLLVTPGMRPTTVSEPLSQIISTKVMGQVDATNRSRGKFQGVAVTITNNSDRAVLFDGDGAQLTDAGVTLSCISLADLGKLSVLPEQSNRKFVTDLKATTSAALSIGWVQTIRDQKQGSGPIVAANGGRYGLDEQRRYDELSRFGKRVLWPGEKTSGVIYFNGKAQLDSSILAIPAYSYYNHDDRSTMMLSTAAHDQRI